MSAKILDGKACAKAWREELAAKLEELRTEGLRQPGLAVIQVGDNPASSVYVRNKHRACEKAGFRSFQYKLPADIGQTELLGLIAELNTQEEVDGILCQLPLPEGYDERAVIEAIAPEKDVDGFHPINQGKLLSGLPGGFVPCTPDGVMHLLEWAGIKPEGKRAVVIGRSNIVGKPMALLLLQANATVTVAHSRTKDLPALCREADILVAAVGRPDWVKPDWIKPGAVVIDVGINRLDDGHLTGDVDPAAAEVAEWLTPVPGGVGPMTIAGLLDNTWRSYLRRVGKA